jgi:hypothetical protein
MRRAHPNPEAIAVAACEAEGRCRCAERPSRSPGTIINRRLCEDRYKAAVRVIIEAVLPGVLA